MPSIRAIQVQNSGVNTWFLTDLAILRNSLRIRVLCWSLAGVFCFLVLVVDRTTALSSPADGWTATVLLFAKPETTSAPQQVSSLQRHLQTKGLKTLQRATDSRTCRSGHCRGCWAPCWTAPWHCCCRTVLSRSSCSSSRAPRPETLER